MDIVEKKIVTVAVITYNSSQTIIETLDSILAQTYKSCFIELIISDDGSKDDTVKVIELWLNEHANKFYLVKLFPNKINGGIPKNCNIAWRASTSEWIKTIAGDDLLVDTCIESNLNQIEIHKCSVLFSKMKMFKYDEEKKMEGLGVIPTENQINFFSWSLEKQYKYFLLNSFNIAPSSFIRRDILIEVDFADERFMLFEDLPLWLKIMERGHKLSFLNEVTVMYRISDSVSNVRDKLINYDLYCSILDFYRTYVKSKVSGYDVVEYYDKIVTIKYRMFLSRFFDNEKTTSSVLLFKMFNVFRPVWYRKKFFNKNIT